MNRFIARQLSSFGSIGNINSSINSQNSYLHSSRRLNNFNVPECPKCLLKCGPVCSCDKCYYCNLSVMFIRSN